MSKEKTTTSRSGEPSAQTKLEFHNFLRYLHSFLSYLAVADDRGLKGLTSKLYNWLSKINQSRVRPYKNFISSCDAFANNFVDTMIETANAHKKYFTCDPNKIFIKLDRYEKTIVPYIGEIASPNKMMFNKDLVIGLILQRKRLEISYRVDYDPKKGLHINMNFVFDQKPFSFAFSGFRIEEERYFVKPQKIPGLQCDLVKFKFFFKMTAYCCEYKQHPKLEKNLFIEVIIKNWGDVASLSSIFEEKDERDSIFNLLCVEYTKARKRGKIYTLSPNSVDSEKMTITPSSIEEQSQAVIRKHR